MIFQTFCKCIFQKCFTLSDPRHQNAFRFLTVVFLDPLIKLAQFIHKCWPSLVEDTQFVHQLCGIVLSCDVFISSDEATDILIGASF